MALLARQDGAPGTLSPLSIGLSAAAHLGLAAALMISWIGEPRLLDLPDQPIPVEIVEVSEIIRDTQVPQESIEAAPRETVEAEPADEPAPDPEPAPPAPAPAAAALPAPTPEPAPKTPKPAEPAAAPAARPQTTPAKPAAQQQAVLVDKSKPVADKPRLNTSELAESLTRDISKNAVLDPRATITLQQLMDAQVSRCFSMPSGGMDVRNMTVQVQFQLDASGGLLDVPIVTGQTGVTPANQSFARALADAAVRAIRRCAPYTLPQELSGLWVDQPMELNFDPSRLL